MKIFIKKYLTLLPVFPFLLLSTSSHAVITKYDELLLAQGVGSSESYTINADDLFFLAIIGQDGTGILTQNAGYIDVVGQTFLGYSVFGTGVYNMKGGTLDAWYDIRVGNSGKGIFNHLGGLVTVDDTLYMGDNLGGTGSYNLSGSSVLRVGNDIKVGNIGTGTFTQTGGTTNVIDNFYLGDDLTGVGTVDFSGGTIAVGNDLKVGNVGTGTFNQTGGTISVVDNVYLGDDPSSSHGEYYLSGGTLNVGDRLRVGDNNTGKFVQSDGVVSVTDSVSVGHYADGNGRYELSGGEVNAANDVKVGNAGMGTFVQTGGDVNALVSVVLGDDVGSAGNYDLFAGNINTTDEKIGNKGLGTFVQGGGLNNVLDTLSLGDNAGGVGTYHLNGGKVLVGNALKVGNLGTGTFNQDNGSNGITGKLILGDNAGSHGTYNLSGGNIGADEIQVGNGGVGEFNQTGGIVSAIGANALVLGSQAGSVGTYNLKGGVLSAKNEIIGNDSKGNVFTQSFGSNSVSNTLTMAKMAGSDGAYELSGGTLNADVEVVGASGKGSLLQKGGGNTAKTLRIGGDTGGDGGTYKLEGGALGTDETIVGDQSTGKIIHSAGNHTVSQQLIIGNNASGDYELSGTGNLFVGPDVGSSSSETIVGNHSSGRLLQSGGTHETGTLSLGDQSGGDGLYDQTGGKNTVRLALNVGSVAHDDGSGVYLLSGPSSILSSLFENIGEKGAGLFKHTAGTNTVQYSLALGGEFSTTNRGRYELEGTGILSAETIEVKKNGLFKQAGGTNTAGVGSSFSRGLYVKDQGVYELSGTGSLSTYKTSIDAEGVFKQSGGTHKVDSDLDVRGQYQLSNGDLSTTFGDVGVLGDGLIKQTGGNNKAKGWLVVSGNNAAYEMDGGSLSVDRETIGAFNATKGKFKQTGGTHTVLNHLILGDTISTGPGEGIYEMKGGALTALDLTLGSGSVNDGTFSQSGGTVKAVKNLDIKWGSKYELSGGGLIAGAVTNGGDFNFSGGSLNLGGGGHGTMTNNGSFQLSGGGTRIVQGNVINQVGGIVKTTGTTVNFTGTFTNSGIYNSDPSDNYFTDLIVDPSGYLIGGLGDNFWIGNDFINNSTQNMLWDTSEAHLGFTGSGIHDFQIAGLDLGLDAMGYQDNFSWGTFEIADGGTVNLFGTSSDSLYLDTVLLSAGSTLNLNGLTLYYDTLVNNGGSFTGGNLVYLENPRRMNGVPEPATVMLFIAGLGGLLVRRRNRGGSKSIGAGEEARSWWSVPDTVH